MLSLNRQIKVASIVLDSLVYVEEFAEKAFEDVLACRIAQSSVKDSLILHVSPSCVDIET